MQGFSLLELLVSLLLVSVLAGMALFSTPALVAFKRSETALQELRTAINYARHTAIVYKTPVIICPKGDGGCGSRNTWHRGALIFADKDGDHAFGQADTLLSQTAAVDSGRIYWRAFRSRSYLLFTPRGLTDWQNGHLLYCPHDRDPVYARQLVLNVTGRTYASRDRDGDNIHEDVRGRDLDCSRV
jgi:type IV fimbrial biogenesis protein FimT